MPATYGRVSLPSILSAVILLVSASSWAQMGGGRTGARTTSVPTADVATQPEVTVYGASVGVGREWRDLRVGLSVPYYVVETDDGATNDSESGMGDTLIWSEWDLLPERPDAFSLTASALFKLPTADEEKGLGTGEIDYGLFLELGRRYEDVRPFLSAGYIWKGDTPEIDYRNTWLYSLGVAKYIGRDELYASFDVRDAVAAGTEDTRFLSVGWLHELSLRQELRFDLAAGLNDGSADLVFTVEWMHWL